MTLRCAAELAADPELTRPRELLVEPVVAEGMVTLMSLLAKAGKSTTLAGLARDASRQGHPCAILTLDEDLRETLQRLIRIGADLSRIYLGDTWEPDRLEEELEAHGVRFLGVDHLGKLAERDPDFRHNSQGDSILWGRLVSPFITIARRQGVGIVLLDQARRSDGSYSGSHAKAATVDIVAELLTKDGALVCTPRGRIALPSFRVWLDDAKAPQFERTSHQEGLSLAPGLVSEVVLGACFRALADAGEEGLRSSQWAAIMKEAGVPKTTWNRARGVLLRAHHVDYASRIYRTTGGGTRAFPPEQVPVVPVGASGTTETTPKKVPVVPTSYRGGTGTIGPTPDRRPPASVVPVDRGDAWSRYLPPGAAPESATSATSATARLSDGMTSTTPVQGVADVADVAPPVASPHELSATRTMPVADVADVALPAEGIPDQWEMGDAYEEEPA